MLHIIKIRYVTVILYFLLRLKLDVTVIHMGNLIAAYWLSGYGKCKNNSIIMIVCWKVLTNTLET